MAARKTNEELEAYLKDHPETRYLEALIADMNGILRGKRADGRDHATIRPITIEVSVLPRVHGSALFTRGETQALVTCTLGTAEEALARCRAQRYDLLVLDKNLPDMSGVRLFWQLRNEGHPVACIMVTGYGSAESAVEMLDQRRLPFDEVYQRYTEVEGVARGIEDMVIRGAPAIGVAAAIGWGLLWYAQTQVSFTQLELVVPAPVEIILYCVGTGLLGVISGYLGVRKLLK